MGDIPEGVYRDAATAFVRVIVIPEQVGRFQLHLDAQLRAAIESAYRAGVSAAQPQPLTGPDDVVRPHLICWVEHQGMLCDRQFGHSGDHVDIYGPLPDHTWPQTIQAP